MDELYINTEEEFCFIYVRQDSELILACVFILIALIILIYSLVRFKKVHRIGEVSFGVRSIFVGILIWSLVSITEFCWLSLYYCLTLRKGPPYENQKFFSVLNHISAIMTGFFVQGLIIKISINLCKNTFDEQSKRGIIFDKHIIYFYKAMIIYQWFRFIRILFLLTFIPYASSTLKQLSMISLRINEVDSVLCLLFVVPVYYILDKYLFKTGIMNKRDTKRLKIEYALVVLSAIYRCGSLFVFVESYNEDKGCPNPTFQNTLQVFILGMPLQQIFPVFTIMNIQFGEKSQGSLYTEETLANDISYS